ncbi:hypothetical protein IDSA_07095 [Pseudidiomarina salinarum]|uniref:Lipoprotein n=1 Tax=Pseudidiomarina salinarum TaxID=435908 RepID=A0A094IUR4_9GAMM|nr:hypothetical protein [Pseudidiomarina salinarum]KFZ30842.1 hypothetical protein IDSA_07095 [Pseudidiomarina salinarum]RUO71313.1 hypothetical protein CWI79_07775 [Pseudidiomarina salinarum]
MKGILVVLFSLLLLGCASMPISTMYKLNSMDETDLFKLDPAGVRAKVQLSEPFKLKLSETEMTFELESDNGVSHYQFPLIVESEHALPAESGWFSDRPASSEYILALSEEASKNFRELQVRLADEKFSKYEFSVNTNFGAAPEAKAEDVTLSIFLKLSQDEGYIALLEDYVVEVESDKKSGSW